MRTVTIGMLFAVFVVGNHYQQAQAQTSTIQRASQYTPPETAAMFAQMTSAQQEQSCYQKAAYFLKRAFGPEYLAAWALVLAAGIALYATFRTLHILKEQTNAAKDSANAAFLNARIVIDSERPWLLIPIGEDGKGVAIQKPYMAPAGAMLYPNSPMPPARGEPLTHCIFSTKNYGNTPARVLAFKVELQIGDSPAEPPDARVYGMEGAEHNLITLPPKESITSQAILAPVGFINGEDQQKVLHGGKYLWLCGFVKYRDTFERRIGQEVPEHETRFCYLYETGFNTPEPFWKPAGPSEYNRAT